MPTRADVQARRNGAKEARRKVDRLAEKKRIAAAEYEQRANRIILQCAVMEAEAQRLYARAAALRRESDPESL